ncbi:MAG: 2Fe-2S iron-sulfur cluster-binding protein [Bacteroidota bacterium]
MPLRSIDMVKLTIDRVPVETREGITIMEAAASVGISIPSMCYKPGFSNHPSCMVCMVKEVNRDQLLPACAMPVSEGMNILTATAEVAEARKEALELLLSDHAGDCEAPCRLTCPAFMDIPLMNRLIAGGDFSRALKIVREEIALPLILGYICPAPCEKACKRKAMDSAVSICLLKRATVQQDEKGDNQFPVPAEPNGKRVAIIGTGPAGLAAAFYLLRSGHGCVLFDRAEQAGGTMRYGIPGEHLPGEILDTEISLINLMGAEFRLNSVIDSEYFNNAVLPVFDAVILATGHQDATLAGMFGIQPGAAGTFIDKKHFTTNLPGVFACGNVIREQRMAVQSVAQGKMAALAVESYLGTHLYQQTVNPFLTPAGKESHHRGSVSVTGHLFETEWPEYLRESTADDRVTPSGDVMGSFTREEAIREAKRCLHCDCRKPASCKLRHYSDEYGASRKRYAGPDRKRITRSLQHETVVYEKEKCIRCGLCVEIAEAQGEPIGLTFAGRGFDVQITVPFGETIREALQAAAAACVEACPTGALAYRNLEERNI